MNLPCIIDGMTGQDYRDTTAVNRGELVDYILNKSRWHKKHVLGLFEQETTEPMQIGSDLHSCYLERFPVDTMLQCMIYSKELVKGPNKGELTVDAQKNKDMLLGMLTSLDADRLAQKWMVGGKPEVSVFAEYDGWPIKCRIDYLTKDYAIDVKTTSKPLAEFEKALYEYRLDWQVAFYCLCCELAGHKLKDFFFLVVEKKQPFDVKMFKLQPERFKSSMSLIKFWLGKLVADRKAENYDTAIEYVDYPAWVKEE